MASSPRKEFIGFLRSLYVVMQVVSGKFLISDHSVSLYRILPQQSTVASSVRFFMYDQLYRDSTRTTEAPLSRSVFCTVLSFVLEIFRYYLDLQAPFSG